jgi:hypothetical protein
MSRYVHVLADKIVKETDKAFLLDVGGEEIWIPFSQVADYEDYNEGDVDVEIPITEWIANEKGLL